MTRDNLVQWRGENILDRKSSVREGPNVGRTEL